MNAETWLRKSRMSNSGDAPFSNATDVATSDRPLVKGPPRIAAHPPAGGLITWLTSYCITRAG